MLIFSSGSCRLLSSFDSNVIIKKKIDSLHYVNWDIISNGNNFISKLHNPKQHLAFLKLIFNELNYEEKDLAILFSMHPYSDKQHYNYNSLEEFYDKLDNIRNNIYNCNVFIFEFCSIKHYKNKYNNLPCHVELIDNYKEYIISYKDKNEFNQDVLDLINYVNLKFNKPLIILLGHIRNWYIDKEHAFIEEREYIYQHIKSISNINNNIKYIDPIEYINKNDLQDNSHYNESGFNKNYDKIYSIIKDFYSLDI